jgi:tetratricopeptide (TPR) repeat protein
MRSYFIAMVLLSLFARSSYAQNNTADSLKQLLLTEKEDTSRVMLLIQLGRGYIYSKPDTTLFLAQQCLTLSRHINFAKGEAESLNIIGITFWLTGNYPKALEAFLQVLKIRESINDKEGMGKIYTNIGIIYSDQGDHKQGLAYTIKAKQIAEAMHNDMRLSITLSNMGDFYEKLNRLDSARFYTQRAYEMAIRLNDIEGRGTTLNNLGNIHSKMDQHDIAIGYYRHSLPDFKSTNSDEGICEATLGMANSFKKTGQADSALNYARQSLSVAERGGFTKWVLDASTFLSAYFKNIRNTDSAYTYQEITIAAKDSLFSQEKSRELQNLIFTEQMRQQEMAEAAAIANEQRRKNIQMMGIGAFIPLFFGIVLFFSKRKTKSRIIEFMGLLGLLLLFEFISLFLHPYIEDWTHHTPVFMLLILVAVASLLVPLHHRLEHWIKERLAHKHPPTKKIPPVATEAVAVQEV